MRVSLTVHVRPGASRTGLKGRRADGTLQLEVAEAPEKGAANEAVERLLAGVLGVVRGRVAVVRGRTSRGKVVAIEGLTEDEVAGRIQQALREREARSS